MENKEKTKINVPVTKDMLKSVGVDAIEVDNPIILLNDTAIVAETLYGDSLVDIYRQLPYKNGGYIMILKFELDMKTGYHEDNVDIRYVLRWFPFDVNRK